MTISIYSNSLRVLTLGQKSDIYLSETWVEYNNNNYFIKDHQKI